MGQKGFATLEVILMVMVIGILASIAVPRFANIGAKANTAKIQADLSTIDTAIAVYEMEQSTALQNDVQALVDAGYLQSLPKPPTSGSCYMEGKDELHTIESLGSSYTIGNVAVGNNTGKTTKRAVLGTNNTADKFYAPGSSSTTTTTNGETPAGT